VHRVERAESLVHPRPDLARRSPEVLEPECDLVPRERHDDLILGVLEHAGDAVSEVRRASLARVQARHSNQAGESAAVEVRHEAGQHAEERRLARSGRPEHGDDLARLDRQRHVLERRLSARVRESQVLDRR
jgi:hypothetical protein